MTTIAILGTGLMGKALGRGWTRAGHRVQLGSRTPAAVTSESLGFSAASVTEYAQALRDSEVVVLALPFPTVAPFVEHHAELLAGKTVIDISNPFDALADNNIAGAEYTAKALGSSDGIVAAYKDNFAATINAPDSADGEPIQVKIASDDPEAKAVAASLAEDLGHQVIDCGPLHNARLIDSMADLMLIIDRAHAGFTMKTGWRFVGLPR